MWVDVVVDVVVEVVRVCRRVWMEERDEKEGRADRSSRSICFTVGTDRPFLSQASRDARRRERGRQAGRQEAWCARGSYYGMVEALGRTMKTPPYRVS